MPLLILCGYPCTGKSDVGRRLREHFVAKNVKTVLVSDEEMLTFHGRDKLYAGGFDRVRDLFINELNQLQKLLARRRCVDRSSRA